ncbi:hypothetical protein BOTBODRAFT_158818 [Botryobasidium botryosum FD-172 SS1]|uniref:BTB domain-containing protein n=1 Tax=Botryobasidium botryosum (strain FD-172 SS1) TaxID=930990 RepID=A0A067MHX8_BOTB1|nr:hypothetical protein BOTBODRAFT_158818 [Botryobasidium botryosum FD-172 SS1]
MAAKSTPAPAVVAARAASTLSWQADLKRLFEHAKERFPDVVWELVEDEGDTPEFVWGHKAIVYSRAPPSFQARYFNFRPAPVASPLPYTNSPTGTLPAPSSFSLLPLDHPPGSRSPSPSPFRSARITSPVPSTAPGPLLRLTTSIAPALFSNELEYLYTGKGIGAAFDFFYASADSTPEGDTEESRIDKLRHDLVYMWRSRLYSDVRIQLTSNGPSHSSESAREAVNPVFSGHRFILVSRAPYFHNLMLSSFAPPQPVSSSSPVMLTLPSPPFTPASLHFTLGYIYTGTLAFSHRSFDLATAFHIYRSASYLSIDTLNADVEAHIAEDMAHGLFHAYLPFDEYERITGGRWGIGGCRCKQCARRAPRILEFALSDDVHTPVLERGAQRALVGLFGEGWLTQEMAALPHKARAGALKGVQTRTTPQNLIPLLFASHAAQVKLSSLNEAWADVIREMVDQEKKRIDEVLCSKCEEIFEQPDWLAMLERDGVKFEDGDKVGWVMDSLKRGLSDQNAGMVYQTLVSSVLIRAHPTTGATLLSSTSAIRALIERTRIDIVRWLRKRWISVRLAAGFNGLEMWALKEISDELEVRVDELLFSESNNVKGPVTRAGLHATLPRSDPEYDSGSIASLRASVLNRNAARSTVANGSGQASGAAVARTSTSRVPVYTASPSVARVGLSTAGSSSTSLRHPPRPPTNALSSSRSSTMSSQVPLYPPTSPTPSGMDPSAQPSPSSSSVRSRAGASAGTAAARTNSAAISIHSAHSVASKASTVRRNNLTIRPPPPSGGVPASRSNSTLSTRSDASRSEKSNPPSPLLSIPISRGRRASATSLASNVSPRYGPSARAGPASTRARRTSVESSSSMTSTSSSIAPAPGRISAAAPSKKRPSPSVEISRAPKSAVAKGLSSKASLRSNTSATSDLADEKKVTMLTQEDVVNESDTPKKSVGGPGATPKYTRSVGNAEVPRSAPSPDGTTAAKSDGASTIKGLGPEGSPRRFSAETIRDSIVAPRSETNVAADGTASNKSLPSVPLRGITLNIGIPCMISSKRSRFKAFARYIGEVQGERGPWIGVEVPVGESWGADKLEGRDWNDGSLGGVRYFDIGGTSADWEAEERASRRRRLELSNSGFGASLPSSFVSAKKREGEQLNMEQERMKRIRSISPAISDASTTESRGLFIRPQQVLLVLGAQEHD